MLLLNEFWFSIDILFYYMTPFLSYTILSNVVITFERVNINIMYFTHTVHMTLAWHDITWPDLIKLLQNKKHDYQ